MPDPVDLSYAVELPPQRAIEYFRSKGYALTWSWRDMSEEAHALAFTVAKSAGFDILGDIRAAVDEALAEGQTYRQFSQNLEPLLKDRGWWGRQVDPDTGESVLLGSPRRLKTIYRTNIRTSMAASRFQAMKDNVDERPYWMYDAINDSVTRPSHAALDGLVFRHDDPFWETHFPPNGFNCRCRVRAFTRRELEQRGLDVTSSKGRMMRVDQDFGVRQTSTMGYQAPGTDGEILIPDPGFGRRPLPGLIASRKTIESMRRAFDPAVDDAIAETGKAAARRVAAIDIDEARALYTVADEPVLDAAIERARRREIGRLIEERRGPGIAATNIAGEGSRGKRYAARMRELARLLPADWVRRANLAPGVTVRGKNTGGGSYFSRSKVIEIGDAADESTLLHEYVHFVQEMHPDLDGLFYTFHRRQTRGHLAGINPSVKTIHDSTYRFRTYADVEYSYAGSASGGSPIGAIEARAVSQMGNVTLNDLEAAGLFMAPLEVMTTTLQSVLTGFPPGSLNRMIKRDRELFEFVLGVLLSSP